MILKDKIYGEFEIKDPLIEEIIQTKAMQRLKGLNQYCLPIVLLDPKLTTTRFEHCIGVFLLLKQLNASREEQIAGLIHDIAHTAFSHTIDFVYDNQTIQDHHENLHHIIIENSEIPQILKKHNLDPDYILNDKNFHLLENKLPNLCADRLDYLMRDAFTVKGIEKEKIMQYLNSFTIKNKEIIIKNKEFAEKIALEYFNMNHDFWGAPYFTAQATLTAEAIKIALKNNIITEKDFLLTDNELFDKLINSNNQEIIKKLNLVKNKENFIETNKKDYDFHTQTKVRFIDPKFIENGQIITLSETNKEFKEKIEEEEERFKQGFYIKLKL
jgi:uncharacterized protein